MPRIFASLHPFFEDGPINGRKKANAGFMSALLEQDPFDEYHFFVANPSALREAWQQLPALPPALTRGSLRAFHRLELPDYLKNTAYHVCHLSDPVTDFAPLMLARNRWAPEIFPITAVNHTISYVGYAAPLLGHVWEGCSPRDAIGCNSTAAQHILRNWYAHARAAYTLPESCREPHLTVIPMSAPEEIPMEADPASRESMRRSLAIKPQTVLLLLFGRIALDDKLDPQPLLMALRRVRQSHPQLDWALVIAGSMSEGDATPDFLHALARIWDVPLTVLPNPSLAEKRNLFAAADIFLSPSDNIQETFGLSLVEAALAGLPVIASDWDGYRDIVEHEVTGLLTPTLAPAHTPDLDALAAVLYDNQHHYLRSQRTAVHVPALAEAVARLAGNAQERQTMGQAARQRALARFTLAHVVQRWLELWDELRARPLPAACEARLRKASHPQLLPFGSVFAPYATATLAAHAHLICTDMGHALRAGKMPWHVLGMLSPDLHEDELRPLLVLARKGCSVDELRARSTLPPERLEAYLLWAIKHDLLEHFTH